jgi:hypothetical protein
MHQQYRTMLASGTEQSGTGAAAAGTTIGDPIEANIGALASLLEQLAKRGINLQGIGGKGIETGGVLLLAVEDGDEDGLERAMTELKLPWQRYVPATGDLRDEPGSLAAFARDIANQGLLIDSLVVGAPNRDHDHDDTKHEVLGPVTPIDPPMSGLPVQHVMPTHGSTLEIPEHGEDDHEHVPGTIPVQATTIRVRQMEQPVR